MLSLNIYRFKKCQKIKKKHNDQNVLPYNFWDLPIRWVEKIIKSKLLSSSYDVCGIGIKQWGIDLFRIFLSSYLLLRPSNKRPPTLISNKDVVDVAADTEKQLLTTISNNDAWYTCPSFNAFSSLRVSPHPRGLGKLTWHASPSYLINRELLLRASDGDEGRSISI